MAKTMKTKKRNTRWRALPTENTTWIRRTVSALFVVHVFMPAPANAQDLTLEEILVGMEEQYVRAHRASAIVTYEVTDELGEIITLGNASEIQYDDRFFREDFMQNVLSGTKKELKRAFDGSNFKNWNSRGGMGPSERAGLGTFGTIDNEAQLRGVRSKTWQGNWLRLHLALDRAPIVEQMRAEVDKVQASRETIDGRVQYRLTAQLSEGDYELVVDPDRSFNLTSARYNKRREDGHFDLEPEYWTAVNEYAVEISEVEFEEIGGHWYAVAGASTMSGRDARNDEWFAPRTTRLRLEDLQPLESPPDPSMFDFPWPEGARVQDRNIPEFAFVAGPTGNLTPVDLARIAGALEENPLAETGEEVEATSAIIEKEILPLAAPPSGGDGPSMQESAPMHRWVVISLIALALGSVILGVYLNRKKGAGGQP